MTPGLCGFFEEPDWVDGTDPQQYCQVVASTDGVCFIEENGIADAAWIESNLTIPLGDAR